MSFFKAVAQMGKSKAAEIKKSRKLGKEIVEKFPLGIRNGSMIGVSSSAKIFNESAFDIGAGQDDADVFALKLEWPKPSVIVAWSKDVLSGFITYNFYLDNGGRLEVSVSKDTLEPVEEGIAYWELTEDIVPTGELDWGEWLPNGNNDEWWVGARHFPLPGVEIDDDNDWLDFSYNRLAEGADFIEPLTSSELIHEGFFEKSPVVTLKNEWVRYYRRALTEGREDVFEFLHLQASENKTEGEKSIELWKGVRLNPSDLDIL